ncbi:Acg family FMN-binding oxidoreductase [Amycolatopsis alba]|uniref:Nitroreductase n=1 Tax=Amycolatopsis alba DSM 44262 TaxID=1125972 RepID=A0A229RFI9_AMYAL|nr:nitroreductase family protein [Amycolatopsis alba]OXM45417.1 nitroreductase [Amycolatopsis alba DSM 44262]
MRDRTEREWSSGEVEVLARAVVRAPSVHNSQPWSLALPESRAELSERTDLALPHQDPGGADRLISCGAALANLVLAVRVLGWQADVAVPDGYPPLVAVVAAIGREPPSDHELHAYTAISRRRSHRRTFSPVPVAPTTLSRIVDPVPEGVLCHAVGAEEKETLAELLETAARAIKGDAGLQAELAAWTSAWRTDGVGDGLVMPGYDKASLPWAGLVRETSVIPDVRTLASTLEKETLLIFCAEDSRAGRVSAGVAMQRTWLSAVDEGLAASVVSQPLHVPAVRTRLAAALSLPVPPQMIMRLGYPDGSVRRTARRPVGDLLRRSDRGLLS